MAVKVTYKETYGKRLFYFDWPNKPIEYKAYRAMFAYFWKSTDYSPISATRGREIASYTNKVNKQFAAGLSLEQSCSIHHIVMKEKVIRGYSRMNNNITKMTEEYDSGTDIVKLSKDYDFPPLNLLRGILLNKNADSSIVYDIFANKSDPAKLLHGRDLTQFKKAINFDAESIFNQQEIARKAAVNEDKFVEYFRKLGVRLKTQEQLTKHQIVTHGRAVITPDLLFLDDVYINGTHVQFIDFKSYIGTDVNFIFDSNLKQAARYAHKWGVGAICYQLGYVNGLTLNGAIPMDGSIINVKYINDLYN